MKFDVVITKLMEQVNELKNSKLSGNLKSSIRKVYKDLITHFEYYNNQTDKKLVGDIYYKSNPNYLVSIIDKLIRDLKSVKSVTNKSLVGKYLRLLENIKKELEGK